MSEQKIRVAVIGGGPGGYVAAIRAAQLGADVTLIEREKLGGTCLNSGCIPTKALLHTAECYTEAKNGAACGVLADVRLDFSKAQAHKSETVGKLGEGIKGLLAVNKVTVLQGEAAFASANSLTVTRDSQSDTLAFDRIIIASGSVPAMPPIPGIDSPQCVNSTSALNFEAVPTSLVVIGGGVIGVEMATLYNTFECKVTIIEMMDEMLPMMDGEMTKRLRLDLKRKGIDIHTGAKVTGIRDAKDHADVAVTMKDGTEQVFAGEKVLVAVGRRTCTEALGLDKVGIAHDRGRIKTNETFETSVPGVYAIGDCLGQVMLAHVASAQGEAAVENALGHHGTVNMKTNPSCVYTSPEFAGVGQTEEQLKTAGTPYAVGKFQLSANGKALIMNGGAGLIKVLVHKESKAVLGVHMLGPRATDIIATAALAIGMDATSTDVINVVHAHPTVAEALREAFMASEKRAIHIPNR